MDVRLLVVAALVVFDLGIAFLASLGLIAPATAVGLLLANPLVLIVEHQLRVRRAAASRRRRS
jgi:hypothetical protein